MDDQRLEVIIGNLLRAGVLIAAAVVAGGGVLFLAQHWNWPVAFSHFSVESAELRSVAGIFRLAIHGNSEGIMQLGLLLLIATPVARVVLAVIGFYFEKDWLYVAVSTIVLSILTFSMMHAA